MCTRLCNGRTSARTKPFALVPRLEQALKFSTHLLLVAGAKQTCAKETAAFNALVASLGGLIKGSAVNVTAGDSLASRGWELDAQALKAKPCDLQLLLKPFGDSAEPDEWQRFSGEQMQAPRH